MNIKLAALNIFVIVFWLFWLMYNIDVNELSKYKSYALYLGVPMLIKIVGYLVKFIWRKNGNSDNGVVVLLFFTVAFQFLIIAGIAYIAGNKGMTDIQFHDTYYVIAKYHVLIAVSGVLGVLALIYQMINKLLSDKLSSILSEIHFWSTCLGILFLISPINMLVAVYGRPRRYYSFGEVETIQYFDYINKFITIVAIVVVVAQISFLVNLIYGIYQKRKMAGKIG